MTKTINEKINDLKTGVDWFYSDDFDLSKAAEKFETLTSLAKEIQQDLDNLKNDIKVIEEDFSK